LWYRTMRSRDRRDDTTCHSFSYGCTVRMNFAAEAGLRTIDYYYNITI
jgi:hypothetical protein